MITMSCSETRSLSLHGESTENRLLCALPADEWRYWQSHLESVELRAGAVLYNTGSELRHMVFPTTATVSLTQCMRNGASTEFAVVGNDGAAGITLSLGGKTALTNAVVQTPGQGFRVAASLLQERLSRSAPVRHLMLRYAQSVLTQMAQIAACNKHHSIEQQLCRWLLMRLDRLSGSEMLITQQMIGNLLGVRRESITGAVQLLQRLGLIHAVRGRMRTLDRCGLETRACECYVVMRRESERLLPKVSPLCQRARTVERHEASRRLRIGPGEGD